MWPIVRQARYLGRYRQIAHVFWQYGFGYLLDQLGLTTLLSLPRRIVRQPAPDPISGPERLRLALTDLGPTFVKLGQTLSTRPDLLPPGWIEELNKLQDTVPPFPAETAIATIEAELGHPIDTLFRCFEREPLAAASLGQVHGAELPDGTPVVVKVQRPDIQQLVVIDLAILTELATLAQHNTPFGEQYDLIELVWEFGVTLRAELDYRREGRNADRFRANFASNPHVCIPRVFWSHTSARVLTTERLFGIKITDIAAMDAAGMDRKRLARHSLELILQEIFVDGFFQGDPHPGNLFVLPGEVIGAVDFGQAISLDRETTGHLLLLLVALLERDADGALRALQRLGMLTQRELSPALRRDMRRFVDHIVGRSLAELSAREMGEELLALLQRHRLRLPAPLALLLKAIIMMEGIGVQIDPHLDVFGIARPYAMRALAELNGPEVQIQRTLRELEEMRGIVGAMPAQISTLLHRLNEGELRIQTRDLEARRTSAALAQTGTRIALGLIVLSATLALTGLALAAAIGGWEGWPLIIPATIALIALLSAGTALFISIVRGG
ncbi:ABC1 kinase family protein [Roseiflexus sp.]|uniref:ABC1 kinase family protein n=1 Tax=Roseiflexus sp. TaxID=2562120 RepID=UPI00398B670B